MPLVPVMPITFTSRSGWSNQAAERRARAFLVLFTFSTMQSLRTSTGSSTIRHFAPTSATAAAKECPREVALALLAGAVENLNDGCVGQMSEIADGDSPHAQKGCTAQAWSVSELLRVWLALGGEKAE